MKKISLCLLLLAFGMSICGCGVRDAGENVASGGSETSEDIVEVPEEELPTEQDETVETIPDDEAEKTPIEPIPGETKSLSYAFHYGLITKDDLETVAYYINNELDPAETLDPTIEASIQETEAESIRKNPRNMSPDYPAENITIFGYYGVYQSKYYVYMITPFGANCCANIRCETIDDVKLFYSESTSIRVWNAV